MKSTPCAAADRTAITVQGKKHQEHTPAPELKLPLAYRLATRLALIPRFPARQGTIEYIADWLRWLCRGAELDGESWTPEDQAVWLVDAVVDQFDNWDDMKGAPGIRAFFYHKFYPSPAAVH